MALFFTRNPSKVLHASMASHRTHLSSHAIAVALPFNHQVCFSLNQELHNFCCFLN
jgi:hypothetical protein